jgi:hypothetical protein
MKILKLFILTSLNLASTLAFADPYKVYNTTHSQVHQIFERQGNLDQYTQTSVENKIESKATVVIRGIKMPSLKETKTSTDVPGIHIPGHSFATLTKDDDGKIYVNTDSLIYINETEISRKYSIPVDFTKGSWNDYIAGKNVELKAKKEGKKVLVREVMFITEKVLEAQNNELLTFDPITFESVKPSDDIVFKGNINHVESFYQYSLYFSATGHE